MTPSDQLPPTGHPETPRSLTPLKDSLEPLEQRVTIYLGGLIWSREQATGIRVFRAPYAQYADAFHVQFKPRYIRSLPPANVILDLRGKVVDDYRRWS